MIATDVGANDAHGREALERALLIRQKVERRLGTVLGLSGTMPENLRAAMVHALTAPGKRLRPVLLYLIAEPPPELEEAALDLGCAVELVHTASLVLDDLPCMDDAQLRRDRVTTHNAFGEATAILSAIALLSRAFGIVAELDIPAPTRARLSAILSAAVGHAGLVAGQEIDLNGRAGLTDARDVERLNWLKTGVLFVACAEMGAVFRGMEAENVARVRRFARELGLAFQLADDLLDAEAETADIGKDVRQDTGKPTIVSLHGARRARQAALAHLAEAEEALRASGVASAPIEALIERYLKGRIGRDES